MKTKMLIPLALIIAFLNNALIANPITSNEPIEKSEIKVGSISKTLIVNVTTSKAETVYLSIEDTEGVVFHSETVSVETELTKRFNLKNLTVGTYNLVIKKKSSITTQPIDVTADKIDVVIEKREILPLPVVLVEGNKLNINVPAKKGNTYDVKIYDNFGSVMYEKTFNDVGRRNFDISNLRNGAYIVEVDGETYPITVK